MSISTAAARARALRGAAARASVLVFALVLGRRRLRSYSTYRATRLVSTMQDQILVGAQVAGASARRAPRRCPSWRWPRVAARPLAEVQASGTLLALNDPQAASSSAARCGSPPRAGGRSPPGSRPAPDRRVGGAIIEGAYVSAPLIGGVELGRHQLVVSVTGGYQRWKRRAPCRRAVPRRVARLPAVGRRWAPCPRSAPLRRSRS